MLEYQNIKAFLQKVNFHSKLVGKSLCCQKAKNPVSWAYLIDDLHGEEIIETFYKKCYEKQKR